MSCDEGCNVVVQLILKLILNANKKTKTMKKNLLMACMAMMFFSCANEELPTKNEEIGDNQTYSLSLKVNKQSVTKGLQTPGVIGSTIKSMIIEVFDGNYNKLMSKDLTTAQIDGALKADAELNSLDRVIINDIDSRAAYVKVWAFQSVIMAENLPVLGKSINNYQTDFASIPFFPVQGVVGESVTDINGFISINKTNDPAPGPNASGNKIWTVESTLAPYFARFEVKPSADGGIIPKTAADSAEDVNVFPSGTIIAITGIYMNNINDKNDDVSLTLIKGNLNNWAAGDWASGHPYTNTGFWSNMYNAPGAHQSASAIDFATNADSYNLFAQKNTSPHVVVRVLVTLPEGSPLISVYGKVYYGFITLRDFKISDNEKLSQNGVFAGKLYKVALDLTVKPSDIAPDPESALADLHAKVTIIDWVEVPLTPEL